MRTTIGRWVVSLLRSFDFIKARVEKHFSSSTLPIMCTMVNSTNLTYSRKLKTNIWYVVIRCHILVNGLMSKGGTIQVVAFDLIVSLNMPCWQSRLVTFNNSTPEPFVHPRCTLFCHSRKLLKKLKGDWQKMHHNPVATNTGDTQSQEYSWHHGLET